MPSHSTPTSFSGPVPLRVLFVEDSELDAELLLEELRRGGYGPNWERVDEAAGLTAALTRQHWDVIICDWVLPRFSALAALELIREHRLGVPTIVVSGQVGEEVAVTAMKAGAHDFVIKDKLSRLCPAIERELQDVEARRARKRAEVALESTRRQMQLVLEAAGEGIYGLDAQGNATFVNLTAARLTGHEPSELLGQYLHAVVHHTKPDGTPYPAEECPNYAAIQDGQKHSGSDELYWRKDGTSFPVEYTATPIEGDGKITGAVIVFRDITERRRAEEALKNHAAQLEEAIGLKDLFTDIMRHDLLNPVGVIEGAADILAENRLDADGTELVLLILRNARKLEEIVKAASLYARLESSNVFERRQMDLNAVFSAVAVDLLPLLEEKQQQLDYRAAGECPAMVNPVIESVFVNLVTNASKYSPQGRRIEAAILDDGDRYRLAVEDWGDGIPDTDKPKLFTRFQRLEKSAVRGTGLGLAIVKRIVELHHGRVWVEDNPEGGSIFFVEIPKM